MPDIVHTGPVSKLEIAPYHASAPVYVELPAYFFAMDGADAPQEEETYNRLNGSVAQSTKTQNVALPLINFDATAGKPKAVLDAAIGTLVIIRVTRGGTTATYGGGTVGGYLLRSLGTPTLTGAPAMEVYMASGASAPTVSPVVYAVAS